MSTTRRESEAFLQDGRLVLSISYATLANAARNSEYFFNASESGEVLEILDVAAFAQDVCGALNLEEEDGSTPLTRALDGAFEYVVEQGYESVEVRHTDLDEEDEE